MDVVVFPDQDGRALGSGFGRRVLGACPDAQVIPALYGVGAEGAGRIARFDGFAAAQAEGAASENAALLAALEQALTYSPDRVAVIATDGYAVSQLPIVMSRLLTDASVIVVDTEFDAGTLRPRSSEEYHQRFVMPSVLSNATGGHLSLSGAHGFVVFGSGALAATLPFAARAIAATARDGQDLGTPVHTGLLTALLLLAVRGGVKVDVTSVPAGDVRDLYDLSSQQCAEQLNDTLRLIRAIEGLTGTTRRA